MGGDVGKAGFWDHLDVLRGVLIRIAIVTVVAGIVAFLFKEELFSIVLAPKDESFVTYRWLSSLGSFMSPGEEDGFSVRLINTGLAQQFMIHMKMALCAGVLCVSPYILYELFRFVSPALYDTERRYATRVVGSGYLMFLTGVLVSYYLIFPLTFRFLGTYQVSGDVENLISLESYMGTLILMSLSMGIVFEMPVLCWLFARLGFLSDVFMRRYRRHAIVLILVVAAVITPTSDVFTLLAVSMPMWLLYETSIFIVKSACRKSARTGLGVQEAI
ncbi:MAG: twin-arginine translocase subunit TatC [Muribaculaceae bacterium]|nr:twin-arginine translocase subunit TatC [Muribaculaceae bacterium]